MLTALNYTNEYRTYADMENNLFGIYDAVNDNPNYLRHSTDDQYNNNVRLGAMLNLDAQRSGNHKYQFKNIFNQLATDRYMARRSECTVESGAQRRVLLSQPHGIQRSVHRQTHLRQRHSRLECKLCIRQSPSCPTVAAISSTTLWRLESTALSTGKRHQPREWTRLDEHIVSLGINDKHHFRFGAFEPDLHAGVYGEYRNRRYNTRNLYIIGMANNSLPSDFRHSDIPTLLSDEANLWVTTASICLKKSRCATTIGATIPLVPPTSQCRAVRKLGTRRGTLEHNDMELVSNTRDYEKSEQSRHYRTSDFFPSLNTTYRIDTRN